MDTKLGGKYSHKCMEEARKDALCLKEQKMPYGGKNRFEHSETVAVRAHKYLEDSDKDTNNFLQIVAMLHDFVEHKAKDSFEVKAMLRDIADRYGLEVYFAINALTEPDPSKEGTTPGTPEWAENKKYTLETLLAANGKVFDQIILLVAVSDKIVNLQYAIDAFKTDGTIMHVAKFFFYTQVLRITREKLGKNHEAVLDLFAQWQEYQKLTNIGECADPCCLVLKETGQKEMPLNEHRTL